MIHVFTDGGSRGNPGQAATGVYITDEGGKKLTAFGNKLGIATNNFAEYTAVIEAFNWLIKHRELIGKSSGIKFFMDSLLVASQVAGIWKIKHPNIKPLYLKIKEKERELGIPVSYNHVYREKNKKADEMVNKALDGMLQ